MRLTVQLKPPVRIPHVIAINIRMPKPPSRDIPPCTARTQQSTELMQHERNCVNEATENATPGFEPKSIISKSPMLIHAYTGK